jgi:hypothetical protein
MARNQRQGAACGKPGIKAPAPQTPVAGKPTSKPLERYVRIVDQGQCFGPAHCCAGI